MIKFKYFLLENRIDFLKKEFLKNMGQSASKTLSRKDADDIRKEIIWKDILQYDPTRKKIYLQWLIKQLLQKNRRDLLDINNNNNNMSMVTHGLEMFDKLKHLIPNRKERDINYYKTYRDFLEVTDKLEGMKTGKQKKRDEYADAWDSADIVYKGSKGMIIIPKTEKAACIFGQGTKWCTTSTNNNQFNHYNNDGDLYIIILKNGDKYQWYHNGEFMDARDRGVDADKFDKKNPWVFDVIYDNIGSYNIDIEGSCSGLPERIKIIYYKDNITELEYEHYLSDEALEEIIIYDPEAIEYITNPSEELQLIAVKNDGLLIQYIDNPTLKIQKAAIENDSTSIEHIHRPNEEIQLIALKADFNNFSLIDFPSVNMLSKYIDNNKDLKEKDILTKIDDLILHNHKAKDLYVKLIQNIKNPSEELQLIAVEYDPEAIEYIENPSEKVQIAAVQSKPGVIRYIKNPTDRVQIIVINSNPKNINWIRNPSKEAKDKAENNRGRNIIEFKDFIAELHKPKEITIYRNQKKNPPLLETDKISLDDMFKKYHFKQIGVGSMSLVYAKSDYPYVIKVFTKDKGYLTFLNWVRKNKTNKYLPKIRGKVVKIEKSTFTVRLEKLKDFDDSKKSNEFLRIMKHPEDFINHIMKLNYFDLGDKDLLSLCKFLITHGNMKDIFYGNIMMRGKNPILIDPLKTSLNSSGEVKKKFNISDFEKEYNVKI